MSGEWGQALFSGAQRQDNEQRAQTEAEEVPSEHGEEFLPSEGDRAQRSIPIPTILWFCNTVSQSSFENIIVHSFGKNKPVSYTKALVQIQITVQLELQNAFKTNACNMGQYFHSDEKS